MNTDFESTLNLAKKVFDDEIAGVLQVKNSLDKEFVALVAKLFN